MVARGLKIISLAVLEQGLTLNQFLGEVWVNERG
jgi:hypothetical protein